MRIELMPHAFDETVRLAIRNFWHSCSTGGDNEREGDGRNAVVGIKNMAGFVEFMRPVDHSNMQVA